MVDATIRAGVRRFVFSSAIHPVLSGLVHHAAKAVVEEAVLNSELEYSFLHPTVYFQNYAAAWPRIVETGVLADGRPTRALRGSTFATLRKSPPSP